MDKYSYQSRKYAVVSYNPDWVKQFKDLKLKIEKIFKDVEIEHVGSTSIPGMAGKECIDILVVVNDLKVVEEHILDMENFGFEYAGEFVMSNSRLFRVTKDNEMLANIHFFPLGHPHNKEMISLRNYLRSHPEEVKAYSQLKEDLFLKYKNEYASYRKYKDEYMYALKERVLKSSSNIVH
jgi:GrpB-like predicted nucleotidyltransferase (UPF0157 family)